MMTANNPNTCTSGASATSVAAKARLLILSAILSFALAFPCACEPALAKPTDNDIVAGQTAAQRGLSASNMPSITAKSAYVVDSDGKVYFERNADKKAQIASITKVMTCIIALENADPDRQINVSARAASIGESTAHLAKGDVLTLRDALIGLMVPSGNDAACAIAENVGADFVSKAKGEGSQILDATGHPIDLDGKNAAYNAFVAKMNEKAKEIGMDNTLFTNPHGLDIDQFKGEQLYSTARDVSKMSVYGMQNADFRDIVSHGNTNIVVKREGKDIKIRLEGTDILIGSYEGACGIKTGHTEKAGGCFTGAVLRNGTYLYSVVLGASSNDQKFDDTKTIYDWVYGNQVDFPLADTDQYLNTGGKGEGSSMPILAEIPQLDWIDRSVKATIEKPNQAVKVNAIFGNVSQTVTPKEVSGDVKAGDVVGAIEYYQGNQLLASVDLVACEDAAGPNFIDSIGVTVQRLFGSFGGVSPHAELLVHNKTEPILSKA